VLDQIAQWDKKLEERKISIEPEPANVRAFLRPEEQ